MHTPRLCIDGRAAADFETQGFLAQEVVDQLVASQGEPHGNEWLEKKRTVLLTHPDQVFSGQLKRFDTKKRIGSSFLYWAWEKHFVESAGLTAFHRFRPADRLEPLLSCPTVTTVLPPRKNLPQGTLPVNPGHQFVVPSELDKQAMVSALQVPETQVSVGNPTIRRYVQFGDKESPGGDGQVLFITDGKKNVDIRKLENVVSNQFPHLPIRQLALRDSLPFSGKNWIQQLQFTNICFYLTERSFDWPFLALEALFFDVPLVFMDNHRALSEMLPQSPLSLSRYLTNFLSASELKGAVADARARVLARGAFEVDGLARQYGKLYQAISSGMLEQ